VARIRDPTVKFLLLIMGEVSVADQHRPTCGGFKDRVGEWSSSSDMGYLRSLYSSSAHPCRHSTAADDIEPGYESGGALTAPSLICNRGRKFLGWTYLGNSAGSRVESELGKSFNSHRELLIEFAPQMVAFRF